MGLSKDPEKRKRQLANLRTRSWKKGESGNPKGRPKQSPLAPFIRDCEEVRGMKMPSPSEVASTYVYIAALPEDKLKDLVNDKVQPMMIRIIAKAILNKKGVEMLEKVVNRAYGQQQRLDITTNGKEIHQEPLKIQFVANKEELAKAKSEISDFEGEKEK